MEWSANIPNIGRIRDIGIRLRSGRPTVDAMLNGAKASNALYFWSNMVNIRGIRDIFVSDFKTS